PGYFATVSWKRRAGRVAPWRWGFVLSLPGAAGYPNLVQPQGGAPMSLIPVSPGLDEVRRNWGWFLVLGIALIVLGIFALGYALLFTELAVLVFGFLLLVSGVLQAVQAVWARRWSGFFLHLLAGILDVVVGLLIVSHPTATALVLTLLLAAFFLV